MPAVLWAYDDLVRAAAGRADGRPTAPITGFSIDTRDMKPGDVFVALTAQRDGHEFVAAAFAAGAAGALVSESYERRPGDGALIRVADTLTGLEGIGRAARARLSADARVIAVTGSAGKTGTKEMLRASFAACGRVHASEKSYNNHWGVPLTLARMPAGTQFGVFEIGMNHPGEITPLTRMVRPHAAIVTTVEPVHLAFFSSVEAIAEAKAEIFLGLEPGGAAVLNRDNPYYELLAKRAVEANARIVSFGRNEAADVRLLKLVPGDEGSDLVVSVRGREVAYRVGAPGAHIAQNSLAVVAALATFGADLGTALASLAGVKAAPGRGARIVLQAPGGEALLIDESYNANPASMRAAIAGLGAIPRARFARRIVVLGDMLELGEEAIRLHEGLKDAIDASGADLVFASGPNMAHLYAALDGAKKGAWSETPDGIREALLAAVSPGDIVMIKGSLGSRMAPLVEAVKAHFAGAVSSH
jgi:UDP-N-acetylmuramoyl-tripeptide--D-alanyl-D-alanine ligase